MKQVALAIAFAALGIALVAVPGEAQRSRRVHALGAGGGPELGGHIGYNFDVDALVLGAQASFPMQQQIAFYPSFDYYTVSGVTEWGLNLDLKVRPPRSAFLYLGGGLNLLHVSALGVSDTKSHLNLLGGLEGQARGFRPYVEGRLILGNGSAVQIAGGASFPLR